MEIRSIFSLNILGTIQLLYSKRSNNKKNEKNGKGEFYEEEQYIHKRMRNIKALWKHCIN